VAVAAVVVVTSVLLVTVVGVVLLVPPPARALGSGANCTSAKMQSVVFFTVTRAELVA